MKPIVIAMQAFGPFAHRQVIDFRELGSKTFFLIHGPTGSGKTTILDGICFALFGDSSGGEREGKQMRSHHADVNLLTEVSFDFALGQERYRVKRVPEQDRPAKRSGREITQAQVAELSRLTTEGGREVEVPVESGWRKVGEKVETLLGFKSEQFRQICEVFVIDVLGISKEEMYAPVEDFAPKLGEHCDLHDESVPVVHFLRNM